MNQVAASVPVVGAFILSTLLLFMSILGASSVQAVAIQDAADFAMERSQTRLTIDTLTGGDLLLGTNITVPVDNTGKVSIDKPSEMDVLIRYTQVNGQMTAKRLTFSSAFVACSLLQDQWCLESISPDDIDPGIWDQGEEATIKMRVQPLIKKSTLATVIIATPNGITAMGSFVNP